MDLESKVSKKTIIIVVVIAVILGGIYLYKEIYRPYDSSKEAIEEVVSNSAWDGSVYQVKSWLKNNLKDPGSLKFIEWSEVVKNNEGGFMVRVKYRAKNSFGGYIVENQMFALDSSGNVTGVTKL